MAHKTMKKKSKRSAAPKRKVVRKRAAKRSVRQTARTSAPAAKPVSKALAPGANWLIPYLTVRDVAAAIDFYENAFGFKLRLKMPGPEGKLMHAELMHNDCLFMLGPENAQSPAPQATSPVTLYAYVEDVDKVTDKASSLGAKVVEPPSDRFWGDRCSIVIDTQGHFWMLATHVKDVRPEDMHPPTM